MHKSLKLLNKLPLKQILFSVLFFLVVFQSVSWLGSNKELHLHSDEAVWILDSRFYEYRLDKDWNKFKLPQNYRRIPWTSDEYRVIDQPQLGKYVFGFILQVFHIGEFDTQTQIFLYDQFVKGELPEDSNPEQLESYLGENMANAIGVIRRFNTIISLILLSIFAVIVSSKRKNSLIIGIVVFLFLSSHPVLTRNFRLALTDGLSILMLLVCSILCLKLTQSYLEGSVKKGAGLATLFGITLALASSIKINGLILVIFFPLIVLGNVLLGRANTPRKLAKSLMSLVINVFSFSVFFYWLEPELWYQPLTGLSSLVGSRLMQQQRFLNVFGHLNYTESLGFILDSYLSITQNKIMKILLILVMLAGMKKIFSFGEEKNYLIGVFLAFALAANAYYARVGFDRYAIPGIFIFTYFTAIGVELTINYLILKFNLLKKGKTAKKK